jgi:hypothetical protein
VLALNGAALSDSGFPETGFLLVKKSLTVPQLPFSIFKFSNTVRTHPDSRGMCILPRALPVI